MTTPTLVWDVQAGRGEGAVWDADRNCLWFVDIKGRGCIAKRLRRDRRHRGIRRIRSDLRFRPSTGP